MKPTLALFALLLLAGCGDGTVPTPPSHLPAEPADIARCFNQSLGKLPDADFNVEEVERAWKSDRLRFVVQQKCGKRFVAWYGSLRSNWK